MRDEYNKQMDQLRYMKKEGISDIKSALSGLFEMIAKTTSTGTVTKDALEAHKDDIEQTIYGIYVMANM